jgi:NADPH:quinone reductase
MFVSFGQSSGAITEFKIADLASGGSLYASRPTLFDYIRSRRELQDRAQDLFARLAAHEFQAHLGLSLPLRDAAEAHRALESRRTTGATVLLTA